tara:strand:- start:748 stop:1017 length:270 start_codon:yes stop_codon:yes gene_type:complete
MIVSSSKIFFNIGIFAAALENAESFNYNIYVAYMVQDSLERRAKMQESYDQALMSRDTTQIEQMQKELDLFDSAFVLTTAMLNESYDEN